MPQCESGSDVDTVLCCGRRRDPRRRCPGKTRSAHRFLPTAGRRLLRHRALTPLQARRRRVGVSPRARSSEARPPLWHTWPFGRVGCLSILVCMHVPCYRRGSNLQFGGRTLATSLAVHAPQRPLNTRSLEMARAVAAFACLHGALTLHASASAPWHAVPACQRQAQCPAIVVLLQTAKDTEGPDSTCCRRNLTTSPKIKNRQLCMIASDVMRARAKPEPKEVNNKARELRDDRRPCDALGVRVRSHETIICGSSDQTKRSSASFRCLKYQLPSPPPGSPHYRCGRPWRTRMTSRAWTSTST